MEFRARHPNKIPTAHQLAKAGHNVKPNAIVKLTKMSPVELAEAKARTDRRIMTIKRKMELETVIFNSGSNYSPCANSTLRRDAISGNHQAVMELVDLVSDDEEDSEKESFHAIEEPFGKIVSDFDHYNSDAQNTTSYASLGSWENIDRIILIIVALTVFLVLANYNINVVFW